MQSKKAVGLFVAALGAALSLQAGGTPQPVIQSHASRVDAIFAPFNRSGSPGCVCAVLDHGRTSFQKAYGMADLERSVPLTTESLFNVGSLTKQFTAAAIALLVTDGKVTLASDLRSVLPEFPRYDPIITLDQLLHHTSGLRDHRELLPLAGWGVDQVDNRIAVQMLARQRDLNFSPGGEWQYSNSNYVLLAEIVTRVSGVEFPEYARSDRAPPLRDRRQRFHLASLAGGMGQARTHVYNPILPTH